MPALLEVPLSITGYLDCSSIKAAPHPPVFFTSMSKQESCSWRVGKDIKMGALKVPVLIWLRILALMMRVVRDLFAAGIGGKLKDIGNALIRAAAELPSAPARLRYFCLSLYFNRRVKEFTCGSLRGYVKLLCKIVRVWCRQGSCCYAGSK